MTLGDDRQLARSAGQLDAETLRWAVDAARMVRTPVFVGMVLAAALMLTGAGVLLASGLGIAGHDYVSLQLPYVISGGFGGLGLMVLGACLASILGNRRDQALADEELASVLTELTALARRTAAERRAAAGGRP